jgi:iron complex transport system ATP-binding protein
MQEGRIVATGTPREVLTAELLLDVFGLAAVVVDEPVSDRPMVVPIGTRHVHAHLVRQR